MPPARPEVRLVVGLSDGMDKLVVRTLLQPVLQEPNLRLLCHEDDFDDLLGDLALHRLDLVLADRPAPQNPNLKLYSHTLGASALAWYAAPALCAAARRGFPRSLGDVPLLLPTTHCRRPGAARPVVRARRTQAADQRRVRGQRAASDLRRERHGRVSRRRTVAREAGAPLCGQARRSLRRRRGALLRDRHRAQGAAPAGAAPAAPGPATN